MKYLIKKGRHYANFTWNRLCPFTKLTISGTLKFDKDDWYSIDKLDKDPDTGKPLTGWNKLPGIAQAFGVHQNSGRFAWQSNFNKEGYMSIVGYTHSGGTGWRAVPITEVQVDKEYPFIVKYEYDNWVFIMNHKEKSVIANKPKFPVKCYPYFGGRSKAPCNIIIEV